MQENQGAKILEEDKMTRDKAIYPMQQVAGGIMSSYFATYLASLLTMVYVMPIVIAGTVESISQVLGWIIVPISGAIIDRFAFKKSKYWPWVVIGGIGSVVCYVLVFSIPVFTADATRLAVLVACILVLYAVLVGPNTAVANTLYARLASIPKLRAYLAMWGKVGRDGMKVVVGLLFPIMLAGFLSGGMVEKNAWALIAVIFAACSIVVQIVVVVLLKKSKLEKDAVAGHIAGKRKAQPLSKTFKAIFTNRALLGAFLAQTLSKVFFFYHVMGGMFLWRYYMNSMATMSIYMTLLSLAAIIGALLVPFVLKIFKDTKRCAVMTYAAQIVIYAAAFFIVSPASPVGTIAIICVASFFNGMSDSFLQPLFAHGADYSVLKSGNKDYGLNMSVFALSVTTGIFLSTVTRTAFLAGGGFDSNALAAKGAAVPEGVMTAIHNLNTLYPLIICAVILLILLFVYPLTDAKVKDIQRQIAERDAAAQSGS